MKDYIDEDELSKVSGGGADRKSFSKMITSLALAGSLCMPVQGMTLAEVEKPKEPAKTALNPWISEKEYKRIPKIPHIGRYVTCKNGEIKYIGSYGLPPKEQFGVMAGVLFCEILVSARVGWALAAHSDWRKMDDHFENIIKNTDKCTHEDLTKYSRWELKKYIQKNVTSWVDVMEDHLQQTVQHGKIGVFVPYCNHTDIWKKNRNLLFKSVLASLCLEVQECRNPAASAARRLEDLKAYKKQSTEEGKTAYIMTKSNSTISYNKEEKEPLTKYHGLPNLDRRNILPVFNYVLANVCNVQLCYGNPVVFGFENKEMKWAGEILNRVTRGLAILPFEWMPK